MLRITLIDLALSILAPNLFHVYKVPDSFVDLLRVNP